MKIQKTSFYSFIIYTMVFAYMLGPSLSHIVGIPRIDNPLTAVFWAVAVLTLFLERKNFPAKYFPLLASLALMASWPALHFFITPLTSAARYADLMFFMVLPCLAYYFYLIVSRHPDSLGFIRRLLWIIVPLVGLPPLVELFTGFQFTSSSELMAVEVGITKGLFFNPNNLGTFALCMTPAVLFFFNLQARSSKDVLSGWFLFALLGFTVFASASRTAILCFTLLTAFYFIYRGNILSVMAAGILAAVAVLSIPEQWVKEVLLSMHGSPFLENISSRLYLFLFELESDNSVSYRQEIYNYFWQNPPFLVTGYGPKNFIGYFGGKLTNELAFENPHSFLIELYLSFGLVSFAAFVCYVGTYVAGLVSDGRLNNRQRFFALSAMALFLIGGFIPSSVFRMPLMWLPCFLIFTYVSCTARQPAAHPVTRKMPATA